MPAPDRTNVPYTRESEQSVLNKSQDIKYDVLAVELLAENATGSALVRLKTDESGALVTAGGGGGGGGSVALVTERYDYASPPIYYVGSATPGSATSASVWTVYRYDLTVTSDAEGKIATNIAWDNRATETYN